jgi:hypothetical protein
LLDYLALRRRLARELVLVTDTEAGAVEFDLRLGEAQPHDLGHFHGRGYRADHEDHL